MGNSMHREAAIVSACNEALAMWSNVQYTSSKVYMLMQIQGYGQDSKPRTFHSRPRPFQEDNQM